MDFPTIIDFIQNFGFPTFVSVWALWRLDKNWGKGENIQARLDVIEESLVRIEIEVKKATEMQAELLTTFKIMQAILTQSAGSDRRK